MAVLQLGAHSSHAFTGRDENRASVMVILPRHHEAPRDSANAALHQARVMIEDEALDTGIPQQGLQERQANSIVGAKQLLHRGGVGKSVNSMRRRRALTGLSANLCSPPLRRVKTIDRRSNGTGRRIGWRSQRVSIRRKRLADRLSTRCSAFWPATSTRSIG